MSRPAKPTPGPWFVSEINSYLIVDMRSQPVAVVSKTFAKEDVVKVSVRTVYSLLKEAEVATGLTGDTHDN